MNPFRPFCAFDITWTGCRRNPSGITVPIALTDADGVVFTDADGVVLTYGTARVRPIEESPE